MFDTLLFASVLPVILIGIYIYTRDSEKEPINLIIKLFFGGVGSCFLASFITIILSLFFPSLLMDFTKFDSVKLFLNIFLGVALVEEFSKWVFVYVLSFDEKNFDQFYDMIVYAAFVALGFACIENILYVFENGLFVALIRALLAVPGHACDGVFMGYYLSFAKMSSVRGDSKGKFRNLFLSLFFPVCLHGFYDYCLFSQSLCLKLVFFIFVIILYIITFRKIRKTSKQSLKIVFHNKFCPNCGTRVQSNFCPICGRKNE